MISFPIDCEKLLKHYGYKVLSYSEIRKKSKELYHMCIAYSDDAFRDGSNMTVAYNEHGTLGRIRFTLMHELGHHILGHKNDRRQNEEEANYFASNILAPRIMIHESRCKNYFEVSKAFGITQRASEIAFDDYRRQYRYLISHRSYPNDLDSQMYQHFYSSIHHKLIWTRKTCPKCHKAYYNTADPYCHMCSRPVPWNVSFSPKTDLSIASMQKAKSQKFDYEPEGFDHSERKWLSVE